MFNEEQDLGRGVDELKRRQEGLGSEVPWDVEASAIYRAKGSREEWRLLLLIDATKVF